MTHLQSLIAKAKAATQGPLTVIRYEHGGGRIYKEEPRTLVADLFQENDREFIASCNPHLILALCELARAAEAFEERLKAIHDDPKYSAVWSSWQIHHGKYDGPRYVQELHDLSAKLAAVRGVNV
jgi:hypothetical protein